MARPAWSALGIFGGFGWNFEGDGRERELVSVRIAGRVAAIILQGPFWNALLAVVGVLEVIHPTEEGDVAFDDGCESFVGIGFVTGDAGSELWDEAGMVELFFFIGAQVGLGAG